jgi:hypothetical protein
VQCSKLEVTRLKGSTSQASMHTLGISCIVLGMAFVLSGLIFLLPVPSPPTPKYERSDRFHDESADDDGNPAVQ